MAENSLLIIVGVIVIVLITAGLTYFIATSNGSIMPNSNPTITVQGEASQTVSPDLVTLGITITGNGSTVSDSQTDAASKMAQLTSALLAAGVKQTDIQTVSYTTSPLYNSSCNYCYPYPVPYNGVNSAGGAPTPASPPSTGSGVAMPMMKYCDSSNCAQIGYQTVHSVEIKSTNVNNTGPLVDASIGINGTTFDYIYFSLQDATRISLETQLEGQAAAEAKAKAQNIAQGVGAKLGKIDSINPNQNYPYPIYAAQGSAISNAPSAPVPTQIYPSDTTLTTSVEVVYELNQ